MTREEFFQQAMLRIADTMLMRASEVPTSEQLARKAREYAQALHNEMVAGLADCDIPLMDPPPEDAYDNGPPPITSDAPTLFPGGRVERPRTPSCPKCGCEMKKRSGRNGPFWGCTDYPQCKGTVNLETTNG